MVKSKSSSSTVKIAVLGGDGRFRLPEFLDGAYTLFKSTRYGGNGEARRLEAGLRSGSFDKVILMVRWNSHSVTRHIKRLCKQLGVPVEVR